MSQSPLDLAQAAGASAAAAADSASKARAAAASARSDVERLNAISTTALYWQGTWDTNKLYQKYAVVVLDDVLYMSLAPGNRGNSPDTSPSLWQHFGSAGGGGSNPSSSIAGLDFNLVEGTPTLRETPDEFVTLLNGLKVGTTSDNAVPLIEVAPGQIGLFAGPGDIIQLQTTDALGAINLYSGETDIIAQSLFLAGDVIGIHGQTAGTISIGHNANDNVQIGLTSDGLSPMVETKPGGINFNVGVNDNLFAGTLTGNSGFNLSSFEDIDLWSQLLNISIDGQIFLTGRGITVTENATTNYSAHDFSLTGSNSVSIVSDSLNIHGATNGLVQIGAQGADYLLLLGEPAHPLHTAARISGVGATIEPGTDHAGAYEVETGVVDGSLTVNTTSVVEGMMLTIYPFSVQTNAYDIVNGGIGGGTLYTYSNSVPPPTLKLYFDGTNWLLNSFEYRTI